MAAPDPDPEERRIAEERRVADLTVRTTGSKHRPFQNQMLQSVIEAQWHHPKERPDDYSKSHAAFQAMRAFAPTDEIEAMIAAQAVGMHAATMECMSRAMIPDQSAEHATALRKSAVSLSRCFVELLGALGRRASR